MIPDSLMNARVEIFVEENTKGSLGESKAFLKPYAVMRGRADENAISRSTGDYHQSPKFLTVFINGDWDLTARYWLRVTKGRNSFLGQTVSCRNPGLMGHHVEVKIESRTDPIAFAPALPPETQGALF